MTDNILELKNRILELEQQIQHIKEEAYGLRISRQEKAADIMADFERQHQYTLLEPWHEAIPSLLFWGLSDQSLHRIFDTLKLVEYQAGRLNPPPVDFSKFED